MERHRHGTTEEASQQHFRDPFKSIMGWKVSCMVMHVWTECIRGSRSDREQMCSPAHGNIKEVIIAISADARGEPMIIRSNRINYRLQGFGL